jgi:hypothetical protein
VLSHWQCLHMTAQCQLVGRQHGQPYEAQAVLLFHVRLVHVREVVPAASGCSVTLPATRDSASTLAASAASCNTHKYALNNRQHAEHTSPAPLPHAPSDEVRKQLFDPRQQGAGGGWESGSSGGVCMPTCSRGTPDAWNACTCHRQGSTSPRTKCAMAAPDLQGRQIACMMSH